MLKIWNDILLITQYHTMKSHKTKSQYTFFLSGPALWLTWCQVFNQRAEQPLALVLVDIKDLIIPVWPGITFLLDDSAGNYLYQLPTFNAESNVLFASVVNHVDHVEGVTIRVVDGHVTCFTLIPYMVVYVLVSDKQFLWFDHDSNILLTLKWVFVKVA